MRASFFIFGLPRSGSSWLSVFLSGRDSFCYHEPTADARPEEWTTAAYQRPESIVGAVDTGAYLYADLVRAAMPNAQFFVLLRDPDEINVSSHKCGISGYDAWAEHSRLTALPFPRLHHESLRELNYLESLWDRVIGTKFDAERARQLLEMNVQRDVQRFIAKHRKATV